MTDEEEVYNEVTNAIREEERNTVRPRSFKSESFDLNKYIQKIIAGGEKEKGRVPATYHQQLALELAKEFNDMAHKGYYFGVCKKYPAYRIIWARDKVRRAKNPRNKGALFTALLSKDVKETK